MNLSYVCFETLSGGTAAGAHVGGIVAGLREMGWSVELFDGRDSQARVAKRLRRYLSVYGRALRSRPDVFYVRIHPAALPFLGAARLLRIPVVGELNGPHTDLIDAYPAFRRLARPISWWSTWVLRFVDGLIAVTNGVESYAAGRMRRGAGTTVIPAGVHVRKVVPVQVDRPFVVYVGSFAKWQGIEDLVAAAQTDFWPPEVDLVVIGDGVERAAVHRADAEIGHVKYLGQLPHEVAMSWLAAAVASVSPKTYQLGRTESTGLFPIKVIESFGLGVPVICTDIPDQNHLTIELDFGEVVPIGDPAALAAAVGRIWSRNEFFTRRSEEIRDLVASRYSWDVRVRETDAFLVNILKAG